jgi:long-chain fatty acid transport protein
MDGDTIEWRYNLAASARPNENMNISVTYRSNVDLGLGGDVTMGTNYPSLYSIATGGSVELPDSDAYLYSFGVRYRVSEAMEVGMGSLYDYKESRTVVNGSPTTGINGEFTDSSAHMLSFGLSYDF